MTMNASANVRILPRNLVTSLNFTDGRETRLANVVPTQPSRHGDLRDSDNKAQVAEELGKTVNESVDKLREEFCFEKNAVRESKVANFCGDEGPDADVDLKNPQIRSLRDEQRQSLEDEREEVQTWVLALKILMIIITALAIAASGFSMIFIFIMAINTYVNVVKNTIPMAVNIGTSMWMLNFSIRGGRVSSINASADPGFVSYIKLCITSVVILLTQLVVMSTVESIPELFQQTHDLYVSQRESDSEQRRANAYVGLGYLIVWANCIFNLGVVGLATTFTHLLRKHLRQKEVRELEQKALPLGYQIYDKIKVEQQKCQPS